MEGRYPREGLPMVHKIPQNPYAAEAGQLCLMSINRRGVTEFKIPDTFVAEANRKERLARWRDLSVEKATRCPQGANCPSLAAGEREFKLSYTDVLSDEIQEAWDEIKVNHDAAPTRRKAECPHPKDVLIHGLSKMMTSSMKEHTTRHSSEDNKAKAEPLVCPKIKDTAMSAVEWITFQKRMKNYLQDAGFTTEPQRKRAWKQSVTELALKACGTALEDAESMRKRRG
jgi:hypothetical protein